MPDDTQGPATISDRKLRLVLMGTGPFAVPAFSALHAAGHECLTVFTRPERPGPGNKPAPKSPVREWAEQNGLTVDAPENANSDESQQILTQLAPDLLVVCDYGQILKGHILAKAKFGGINLHGSLLPAFRGAAPVQWAVLTGQSQAGVSVIHMTPKLDAGPIITSRKLDVLPKETAGELETRLSQLGVEPTLEAVAILTSTLDGIDLSSGEFPQIGSPQDQALATKAPRLNKPDARVPWHRTAEELDWHVRGMQPWPTAFTEVEPFPGMKGQPPRIVVLEVEPVGPRQILDVAPGTTREEGGKLLVACGDGWVKLKRLKPAGKREMSSEEWLRGRPFPIGTKLN